MQTPDGQVIMQSPDGELFAVHPEDAQNATTTHGWAVAPDDVASARLGQREQYAKHGSVGQQALGLAETATRAGTLGLVKGFGDPEDIRGRAQVTDRESPVLSTVASAVPATAAAVGVGLATGGAGLAAGIAAQGAVGGLANVGVEADAAFKADEQLSAEAAWGAFGKGLLLGTAAELGVVAMSAGARAVTNRFVQASGAAARRTEQQAFERAGLVRPAKDLGEAVEDPVKAAALRQRAEAARAPAAQSFEEQVTQARALADQVQAAPSPAAQVSGDVFAQRSAAREALQGISDDLGKIGAPEVSIAGRGMLRLDAAESSEQIFDVIRAARRETAEALDTASTPEVARALKGRLGQLEEAERGALFGEAGPAAASQATRMRELGEARVALDEALSTGTYLDEVGTAGGQRVEQALDSFLERLSAAGKGTPAEEAAGALARRVEAARGSELAHLAAGNQVNALSRSVTPGAAPKSMARDLAGEAAETLVETVLPGAGLIRKAWKYRKHVMRLASSARGARDGAVDGLVMPTNAARSAQRAGEALQSPGARAAASGAARGTLAAARTPLLEYLGDDPQASYSHAMQTIRTLADNPGDLANTMATQFGDMPEDSPELFTAISEQANRALSFLNESMPRSFEFSLAHPNGPPPSRSDMIQAALYWRGVTDPYGVMASIGDGSAMPEEVEAFRAVFPSWYSEFRDELTMRVQEVSAQGVVIPAGKVSRIETLLEADGVVDRTFSDDIAMASAAASQEAKAKPPSYVPRPRAGARISEKESPV
jgi:hypothetical protein